MATTSEHMNKIAVWFAAIIVITISSESLQTDSLDTYRTNFQTNTTAQKSEHEPNWMSLCAQKKLAKVCKHTSSQLTHIIIINSMHAVWDTGQ